MMLCWLWLWLIRVSAPRCSGLDIDLTTLLVWLAKNRSIRHLSIGKNFNNIKSKWVSNRLQRYSIFWIITARNEEWITLEITSYNCLLILLQKCGSGPGQPGSHDSRGGISEWHIAALHYLRLFYAFLLFGSTFFSHFDSLFITRFWGISYQTIP